MRRGDATDGLLRVAAVLLAGLASAACDELTQPRPLAVTIEPATSWPAALAITETDTVEVTARLTGGGEAITGVDVEWSQSEPSVLDLEPITSGDGRMRAAVTALSAGTSTIEVRLDHPGFEPTQLAATISAVPLGITGAPAPDPATVTDVDTLSVVVTGSAGQPIQDVGVSWASSDQGVLEVVALAGTAADTASATFRAEAVARAPGRVEVTVTVSRAGFSSSELRDSIRVVAPSVLEAPSLSWPSALVLADVDTVGIEVRDAASNELTDLRVIWTSSDPEILGVARAVPTETDVTPEQIAEVHRKAVLTARREGSAEVIVIVDRDGFEPTERRAVVSTVVPTTLQPTSAIVADTLMDLTDTLSVGITLRRSDGTLVTGREIEWRSGNAARLEVVPIPGTDSATVIARDTGTVAITAVVDPDGFQPVHFSDTVRITPLTLTILAGPGTTEDTIPNSDVRDFQVEVRDIHDSIKVGRRITWRADDPTLLEISPTTPGAPTAGVRALRRGTAVVSAAIGAAGDFLLTEVSRPVRVTERWVSVSVGAFQSCAVSVLEEAYCWGIGEGLGSKVGSATAPTAVIGDIDFATVSSGRSHACGLTPESVLYCWGFNGFGALGDGGQISRFSPAPVNGGNFIDFDVGEDTSCGVRVDGLSWCWGNQRQGQIGSGATFPNCVPFSDFPVYCVRELQLGGNVEVRLSSGFSAYSMDEFCHPDSSIFTTCHVELSSVSVGRTAACGVSPANYAFCWGTGPLGGPSWNDGCPDALCSATATLVGGASGWTTISPGPYNGLEFLSVSVGDFHACGVVVGQSVYCWGTNGSGQLGTGDFVTRTSPTQVPGLPGVIVQVVAGAGHSCALTTTGTAWCWGNGQSTAVAVQGGITFELLSADGGTCGVSVNDGALYCWDAISSMVTPVRIVEPQ
jgi:hypothetical protein